MARLKADVYANESSKQSLDLGCLHPPVWLTHTVHPVSE